MQPIVVNHSTDQKSKHNHKVPSDEKRTQIPYNNTRNQMTQCVQHTTYIYIFSHD